MQESKGQSLSLLPKTMFYSIQSLFRVGKLNFGCLTVFQHAKIIQKTVDEGFACDILCLKDVQSTTSYVFVASL